MDCNRFFCLCFYIMTTSFTKGQKPSVNGLGLLSSKACHFISKSMSKSHLGQCSSALT